MRILALALLIVSACGSSPAAPDDAGGGGPDLTAVTWTTFAQPFFQKYCVSCHQPGGQASLQDFNQFSVVQANAPTIRCGVAPAGMTQTGCGASPAAGQFPLGSGPHPTDGERLTLISWIDAGLPM